MKKIMYGSIASIFGFIAGVLVCSKMLNKGIQRNSKAINKFKTYYEVLNQWIALKQEGNVIEEYFEKNKYKTVAIYGMGGIGKTLYKELENSNIIVKYCIDKDDVCLNTEVNVIDLEGELQPVDAVIVTAMFAFEEIEEKLREKIDAPIISLEDIIFSI